MVDPPGHRARAGAVANLTDVILAQLRTAEAQERLRLNPIVDVIIACDAPGARLLAYLGGAEKGGVSCATQRWRSSVTRCDVFVDCDGQMGRVAMPNAWGCWWALDGGDTTATLLALGQAAGCPVPTSSAVAPPPPRPSRV